MVGEGRGEKEGERGEGGEGRGEREGGRGKGVEGRGEREGERGLICYAQEAIGYDFRYYYKLRVPTFSHSSGCGPHTHYYNHYTPTAHTGAIQSGLSITGLTCTVRRG